MSNHIHSNLRFLRNHKGMTQQSFAEWLGIKRSSLGAYEEGRAKPGYDMLTRLTELFGLTIDQLLTEDLSKRAQQLLHAPSAGKDVSGKQMRVLSITVDPQGREFIDLVPEKAAAGYLNGYADPEYVEELPKFRLPMLKGGTFRAFEISGDSMLPIQPGSVVIGEYVEDWKSVKDGLTYIVVSVREGIVYKRLFNKIEERGDIICQSDNPAYPPYSIPVDEVLEIWQAKAYLSTIFPDKEMSMEKLMAMVLDLQQEIIKLKNPQD